ncbi:MAG TPA: NAD(P)-dependent oxidoreductase [Geminicoccaceae bacterium]|nr:NAD(P)-dependent oxidoreductase [Geminicoccaceae bacterium]
MRRLGFLGLGQMGGGMVKSLLRARFPVVAFDPQTQLVQAAVKDGATAGTSPADVAARSEVVLSSLPDPAAVREAALGPHGIIETIGKDQVYIDLSSIDPATTREVGSALAAKGTAMLDVPVGKGPPAAAAGDLTLMIGGDPAVIERCRDILAALGSTQFHCGPLGSGVAVKLVNNLVSCSLVALNAEAMALAAKADVDPQVVCEVLQTTAADNWHLRNTMQALSLDRNFAPRFKLRLAHKDLGLALAMGMQLGVPLALGQASYLLHTVAMGQGLGDEDQGACLKPVEQVAGVEVRRRV